MDFEQVAHLIAEIGPVRRQPIEQCGDLALHLGKLLFGKEAPVDGDHAAVRNTGRRQAGIAFLLFRQTAMDGVDVECRLPRALGHNRHRRAPLGQRREQAVLHFLKNRRHMPNGAVAKERHRAVRDTALSLDLGPPNTTMTYADTVLVQWFRDDHMLHPRWIEPAIFGQIRDAAEPACFLVRCAGDLDCATIVGTGSDKGLRSNNGCRQPAFHVTGAPSINPVAIYLAAERVAGPALTNADNIGMRIEMHAFTCSRPLMAADNVPAWILFRIAKRSLGPDECR